MNSKNLLVLPVSGPFHIVLNLPAWSASITQEIGTVAESAVTNTFVKSSFGSVNKDLNNVGVHLTQRCDGSIKMYRKNLPHFS